MATFFHGLPPEVFDEKARPYIKRLNSELRELFALEGALRNPTTPGRRSDNTVIRHADVQVDVSRISPSILTVVAGTSSVVGTPNLTLGTVNTVGSTSTVVSVNSAIALFGTALPRGLSTAAATGTSAFAARADHIHAGFDGTVPAALAATAAAGVIDFAARRDHVHLFPTALRSTANASTLTLTDDGTDTTLTNSLGLLRLTIPGIIFSTPTIVAATRMSVILDPDFNAYGIQSQWASGGISSTTVACWDAKFSSFGGVWASPTVIGYDQSTGTLLPTSGSSGTGTYYGIRMQPQISNANLSWGDVASGYFRGVRRLISSPTITTQTAVIIEPPTAGTSDQIGILIRQQSAQATAANRIGIEILPQNSGTNRWSMRAWDQVLFSGSGVVMGDTANIILGVTTGTQFGTSNSQKFAFSGATPITQSTGWSVSNVTATKTLNGSSFTLNDTMNVLGTILTYLQSRGDIAV